MLTKKVFVEACEFIKKKRRQESALCDAFEACCPDNRVDALIYSDYEAMLVTALKAGLDIDEDNDFLDYWIYDTDMGEEMELGDYSVNDEPVDISTPEKFYDYITENKEGE